MADVLDDLLVLGGLLVAVAVAAWIDWRLIFLVAALTTMVVGFVRAG